QREKYLHHLAQVAKGASRSRATQLQKEENLLERIGLTERITMQREANAMRHWRRRQRDWAHVKAAMSEKTGKASEDLVMSTAGDYRERSEEYTLIQNAIPLNEKYSCDGYWMMSLRGYGERHCSVGNIFSGLFCEIGDKVDLPRVVRPPTGCPMDSTRKRTWRDSHALKLRKRQLASTLQAFRPQTLQPSDTKGLLVEGQDLLEWAVSSSKDFFERQDRLLREVNVGKHAVEILLSITPQIVKIIIPPMFVVLCSPSVSPKTYHYLLNHTAIQVTSLKFLLMKVEAGGDLATTRVTMRNVGSTVLFFSWSRILRGTTIVSENVAESRRREEGESKFVTAPLVHKDSALLDPSHHFFCHEASGTLLPEVSKTVTFSFKSEDPGMFSDRWRLETVPVAAIMLSFTLEASSLPGKSDNSRRDIGNAGVTREDSFTHSIRQGPWQLTGKKSHHHGSNQEEENCRGEVLEGFVEVDLRGAAHAPDRRGHARKRLAEGFDRGLMVTRIGELLTDVIRGVHTPIREEEVCRTKR
ncbi:unnamed protein product, partial [Choristocarpus tenellus]